ncbi:MAG: PAS domain-containing protein [Hyphomonadaceae bacterium]
MAKRKTGTGGGPSDPKNESDETSALRASEARLRESELRYRTLFNAIDEGFCIIEFIDGPHGPLSDYVHVEANDAYTANAGIPDVVGQKVRAMVGEEAQGWIDLYGEVLRTGTPIRFERELVATGRWLELAAFRVEPPSRNQVAVLFRDQTARRRAEEALRASEADFRTLASVMPNQAWTAKPNGMLDWFNERVYAFSGASLGSLDGADWASIVHPDDIGASSARWMQALSSGEIYETEFRLRRADGVYRWHIARAVPVKAGTGEIIRWIGTNTDIHDQKEIAETLEQRVAERTSQLMEAEEALRQSQKMEAVGQLTGGIAHDFNNLLAAIGGSMTLIERRLSDGKPGVERYISAAQDAVKRAAALTQRLLAFSRRQTLDPRPTDINRLVSGMEELIRRSVGPNVEVEVVGAAGLWATKIDASQLESALLNLCINARDAMAPDGGRLTIETANRWLDDRAAKERDLVPGQYVSLCVTDTGTGMTPDVIERAFDPFFTTKPIGQGTGLGLSMVYGFVRQSGGQVRIYSELGKGAMVCLYVPRYAGGIEDAPAATDTSALKAGGGETILVIDDEPTLRMLINDVLSEAGYVVWHAPNGPDGLRYLEGDARVDLLITDVGLPGGLNGRQVAESARMLRPGLKVLFITGYAENAVIGNGHLEVGMEIVTKPFAINDFAAKVRDILDR